MLGSKFESQIWKQGFPNENLSCYFNSFVQMYINCLEKLPWMDTQNNEFNRKVRLIQNEDPIKFRLLMQELNSILVYSNQNNNQGNDPIRVMSAVIQNTLTNLPKLQMPFLPTKFREVYEDYAKENSETSFLFQSIFYEGGWCNTCKSDAPISESLWYFITLNMDFSKEKGSRKLVQTFIDKMYQTKKSQQINCKECKEEMKNICGFIKLPKFLYLNLNQELPENIEIDQEIEVKNESDEKSVTYSLEGVINHPPAHYTYCRRDKEKNQWISYDDDYVSNIAKPRFPKGLLYVAINNEDDNIKLIKVESLKKSKPIEKQVIDILTANEQLLKRLQGYNYEDLKIVESAGNSTLIQGKYKKSTTEIQNVMIRVLKIQEGTDISKYSHTNDTIKSIQSEKIILNINTHHFNSHNQYAIVNDVGNLINLEQQLDNQLKGINDKTKFFVEFLEFLQGIEQKGLKCSPLQLKDIWINSENKWRIFSLYLFSDQQESRDDTLHWIRTLLSQLFPKGKNQLSNFNDILSFLIVNQGEQYTIQQAILKTINYLKMFCQNSVKQIQSEIKNSQQNANQNDIAFAQSRKNSQQNVNQKGSTQTPEIKYQQDITTQKQRVSLLEINSQQVTKSNDTFKNQETNNQQSILCQKGNNEYDILNQKGTDQIPRIGIENSKNTDSTSQIKSQKDTVKQNDTAQTQKINHQQDISSNEAALTQSKINLQNANQSSTAQMQEINNQQIIQSQNIASFTENLFHQLVDSKYCEQNSQEAFYQEYKNLKIVKENQNFSLLKGINKNNQNVIITSFKIKSEKDVERYTEMCYEINQYSHPDIIQSTRGQISLNNCFFEYTIDKSQNLQQQFVQKCSNNKAKIDIVLSIMKLFIKAESKGIRCQSVQLDDIYLYSNDKPAIPSIFFFSEKSNEISLFWLEIILKKLLNFKNNNPSQQEIQIGNNLISCLQNNSKESLLNILDKMKNIIKNDKKTNQVNTFDEVVQDKDEKNIQKEFNNLKNQFNDPETQLQQIKYLIQFLKINGYSSFNLLEIKDKIYFIQGKNNKNNEVQITIINISNYHFYNNLIKEKTKSLFVLKNIEQLYFDNHFFIVEELSNLQRFEEVLKKANIDQKIKILQHLFKTLKFVEEEKILNLNNLELKHIWIDKDNKIMLSLFYLLKINQLDLEKIVSNTESLSSFGKHISSYISKLKSNDIKHQQLITYFQELPKDISISQISQMLNETENNETKSQNNLLLLQQKQQQSSKSNSNGNHEIISTSLQFSSDDYYKLTQNQSNFSIQLEEVKKSLQFLSEKYSLVKVEDISKLGVKIKAKNNQQSIIIKIFSKDKYGYFISEGDKRKKITSPNISKLLDFYEHPQENLIFFVEEEINGENYLQYINSSQHSMKQRLSILKGIFEGYLELQNADIFVGNFDKKSTIVINSNNQPIIDDFGLITIYQNGQDELLQNKNNEIQQQKTKKNIIKKDLVDLLRIFGSLDFKNKLSEYKLELEKNLDKPNTIKDILTSVISEIQKLVSKIESNMSFTIKNKKFETLNTFENIKDTDTVFNLKKKIKVPYKYVLLDKDNNKLEDDQRLSFYNFNEIQMNQLTSYEVNESDNGEYTISYYCQSKGNNIYLCNLKLEGSQSVKDIKKIIFQKYHIPVNHQKLTNQSSELQDNLILAQCSIMNNTINALFQQDISKYKQID